MRECVFPEIYLNFTAITPLKIRKFPASRKTADPNVGGFHTDHYFYTPGMPWNTRQWPGSMLLIINSVFSVDIAWTRPGKKKASPDGRALRRHSE